MLVRKLDVISYVYKSSYCSMAKHNGQQYDVIVNL